MKGTLAVILGLAASLAWGQPMITEDNLPQVGDHVTIGINWDEPSPGPGGAGQTWDFSGLVEQDEQYFDFVDPADTEWSEDFPAATICGVSWDDTHSYYGLGRGPFDAVGYAVPFGMGDVAKTLYEDAERILELPYGQGDDFTDGFAGTLLLGGTPYTFTGSLYWEADGQGTLILPTGTYDNVVRYYVQRQQETQGSPRTTQNKEQWAWVSADYRFWLLLMESNFDGFSWSHLTWWDKNPAGVTAAETTSWSAVKALF